MRPRQITERPATYHLLDVREDEEWAAGHIAGAQHIPLKQLAARLDELPRERDIVTVCRSGHRSGIAARGLVARGYRAENLEGGLEAWVEGGLPLRTADDAPGRVL
ncbi:MAG: rhodanese-like domain-containing protein [Candidatus Limnocylindria bacterium]